MQEPGRTSETRGAKLRTEGEEGAGVGQGHRHETLQPLLRKAQHSWAQPQARDFCRAPVQGVQGAGSPCSAMVRLLSEAWPERAEALMDSELRPE